MIGLKRYTVKLSQYRPVWAWEFEVEKQCLMDVLGSKVIDIQHIGSTSIPGLVAKPIIDLSIGIRRFKDAEKLIKPLAKLGYRFDRKFQHQRFFAKGPDARRTHYLHLMRFGGKKWKSDKLFRNYLRAHPRRIAAYAALKEKLAKRFPNERQKYSDGKDQFIKETLRMALGKV